MLGLMDPKKEEVCALDYFILWQHARNFANTDYFGGFQFNILLPQRSTCNMGRLALFISFALV